MLFLLKRRWQTALVACAVLVLIGTALRLLVSEPPQITLTARNILTGLAVFTIVLASDGLLHGLFILIFGKQYTNRSRLLVACFRKQTLLAMVAGALLAGAGEELVFRGVSLHPAVLIPSTIFFGLLHHIRLRLWPVTLWAMYQGVLFGIALLLFEDLSVTMTAHFLHDFAGFCLFRYLNRRTIGRS